MNKTQFWQLIEASWDENAAGQSKNLKEALTHLSADEILGFHRIFRELEVGAYRWDLWGVAYIINGGCSDDCFIDFRSMLVRRGEKFYNAMLAAPEVTAISYDLNDGDWDDMFGYCIVEAYEEVTGQSFPERNSISPHDFPPKPTGKRWNEEELEVLFPRLSEKFE